MRKRKKKKEKKQKNTYREKPEGAPVKQLLERVLKKFNSMHYK
jgi:hypothetical protein